MKSWTVTIKPSAEKNLNKLSSQDRQRVIESIKYLKNDPLSGKKLKGNFEGCFSLRVWPYRVIYVIEKAESVARIILVDARKDVYK